MSDRPTPITDEIDTNQKSRSWESSYWNMRDHARDLERQLTDARDNLSETQKAWVIAKAERAEAIRQRDEARDEIARLNKSLSNASSIYDAACEQRDRLAEALDTITLVVGLTPIAGNKQALQEAMDAARSELAAVEGGNP